MGKSKTPWTLTPPPPAGATVRDVQVHLNPPPRKSEIRLTFRCPGTEPTPATFGPVVAAVRERLTPSPEVARLGEACAALAEAADLLAGAKKQLQAAEGTRSDPEFLKQPDLGARLVRLDQEVEALRRQVREQEAAVGARREAITAAGAAVRKLAEVVTREAIDARRAEAQRAWLAAVAELPQVAAGALDKLLAAELEQQALAAAPARPLVDLVLDVKRPADAPPFAPPAAPAGQPKAAPAPREAAGTLID